VWYSFTCSYLCVEQRIDGEVYDVDDKMLAFMDHFEGHPEVYNRDMVGKQFQRKAVSRLPASYRQDPL